MSLNFLDAVARQVAQAAPPAAVPCPPDNADDVLHRRITIALPNTLLVILAILTYVLRIIARRRTRQKLGWDDYLMGIGTIVFLNAAICSFLVLANGAGHHLCNVPVPQQKNYLKINFALQRSNQLVLGCAKVSICLFYLRIFPSKAFRKWVYAVIVYTILWAISTWIVNLTTCMPIAYFYDKTIVGGLCRNQTVSGSINAGLSLLGDAMVLVLPLPQLLKLKINKRRKGAVVAVFLLGSFGCVAGLIRLIELTTFVTTDGTYTQVYVLSWTNIEQGVAVVSGNLPLLGPLLRGVFGRGDTGVSHGYVKNSQGYGVSRRKETYALDSVHNSASREARPTDVMTSSGGGNGGGVSKPVSNGNDSYVTTLGSTRGYKSGSSTHVWERLSDTESATGPASTHDLELDDKAILVKKQVEVSHTKS